jgi:hypothetical protein
MHAANENLWHGAPLGQLHHVLAGGWVLVNANFFDVCHAALLKQLLGPNAIGAHRRGKHFDSLHDNPLSVKSTTVLCCFMQPL